MRLNMEKTIMSSTASTLTSPKARTVASTQSETSEIVLPNDTNVLGSLLGGRLMHFIDMTGAMAAYRHARTYLVTASMDHIDFIRPVRLGSLVTLKASVNRAFTTSMEVGVKVWTENPQTGELLHVASAYLVFVAVDKECHPQKVPASAAGDAQREAPLRGCHAAPQASRGRKRAPQAGKTCARRQKRGSHGTTVEVRHIKELLDF